MDRIVGKFILVCALVEAMLLLPAAYCLLPDVYAEFQDYGVSARAAGMGDCFTTVADDSYAMFYNPAGLGLMKYKEVATTSSRLLMGLTDLTSIEDNVICAMYGTPRYGTFGVGLNNYTVSGLYKESTTMLSYGSPVWNALYLGGNIKYMSKEYVPNPYTENATDFSGATYGRDPVFMNGYGKSFTSYDIGSHYQFHDNRIVVAAVAKDITSPDTGLASTVKLPMSTVLGVCYRDEDLSVPVEIRSRGEDLIYAAGFERWLFMDQVGLRAGFQKGSRDFSELSCGLSYSYNNIIRFDYGFSTPLSGLKNTTGSHRISLVVSIGKPRPDYFDISKQPKEYRDAVDAYNRGEYITAYDLFDGIAQSPKSDRLLKKHAAAYTKSILVKMNDRIAANTSPTEVDYAKGLVSYSQLNYENALAMWEEFAKIIPDNVEVNYYIELLKKLMGMKGGNEPKKSADGKDGKNGKSPADEFPGLGENETDPDMSSMSKEGYIDFKLRSAVVDFNQARFELSVKDCLYVLRVDNANELAFVRLGSAYFALGLEKYAVKAWQKALQINPNNRDLIDFMDKKKIPVK